LRVLLPCFCSAALRLRHLHSFPTRRSSDLASLASEFFDKPYEDCYKNPDGSDTEERKRMKVVLLMSMYGASKYGLASALDISVEDRKSTRLNSSHVSISYAVFCLKKKKILV